MKILTTFILALLMSASALAQTAYFAVGEWSPFTSEKNVNGKLLERIVTEAYKLEKINVVYTYFPWKRSYSLVEAGESDGTLPWGKTEEREKNFIIHKIPLIKDESVFFHLKSKPFKWEETKDLKKYKLGVTLGYKNESLYKEQGLTFEVAPTEEMNFKKLAAGRMDAYSTSKLVGFDLINNTFTPEEKDKITFHPKASEDTDYYLLFSKKTANGKILSDKLDSGLTKLKANGGYDKLIKEYIK